MFGRFFRVTLNGICRANCLFREADTNFALNCKTGQMTVRRCSCSADRTSCTAAGALCVLKYPTGDMLAKIWSAFCLNTTVPVPVFSKVCSGGGLNSIWVLWESKDWIGPRAGQCPNVRTVLTMAQKKLPKGCHFPFQTRQDDDLPLVKSPAIESIWPFVNSSPRIATFFSFTRFFTPFYSDGTGETVVEPFPGFHRTAIGFWHILLPTAPL